MEDNTERPSYEPELTEPPAPSASARFSAVQRLWMVFTSPGEVFADIGLKPTWALIFLALAMVGIIFQFIFIPHLDLEGEITARLEERSQEIPGDQLEQVVRIAEIIARVQVVVFPLGALLIAAASYLLMLKLVGSEADFARTLSTTLHSYWPPTLVGLILSSALLQRIGKVPVEEASQLVKDDLGAFLSPEAPAWLTAAASSFSVFNVWTIILLIIGFAIVGKIPRGKAAAVTLIPWVAYILAKAAFAAFTA